METTNDTTENLIAAIRAGQLALSGNRWCGEVSIEAVLTLTDGRTICCGGLYHPEELFWVESPRSEYLVPSYGLWLGEDYSEWDNERWFSRHPEVEVLWLEALDKLRETWNATPAERKQELIADYEDAH